MQSQIKFNQQAYETLLKQLQEIKAEVNKVAESNNATLKTLFSNDELSSFLGVSTRTLQNYRDKGLIPFSQIGSKIFYTNKDIEVFLKKHKKV